MNISLTPWKLHFDGSRTKQGAGAGIVFQSPLVVVIKLAFELDGEYSNNQVEYEALIRGLEILKEPEVSTIKVFGDLQ